MSRKLKVYGWLGFRNYPKQSREVVAAHSLAEVARIAGAKGPWALFNLGETGNAEEIKAAMGKPGTIFWRSNGAHRDEPFTEVTA